MSGALQSGQSRDLRREKVWPAGVPGSVGAPSLKSIWEKQGRENWKGSDVLGRELAGVKCASEPAGNLEPG